MKQIKIAFIGKTESGQRAAAIHLKRHYGFSRMRLMDGARRVCLTLYGLQRIDWRIPWRMYHHLYKFDPTIWTTHLDYRVRRTTKSVIVEDVRYVSEAHKLREMGFIIIRLSSDKKRRYAQTTSLGTGAMVIEEFSLDSSKKFTADYSIHANSYVALRKSLDSLLNKLDTEDTEVV